MASMEKKDIMVMVIVILTILLLASVTYIVVSKYKEHKINKENALRQEGYQAAVLQLMEQAASCEPVVIFVDNRTTNLVSLDCLRGNSASVPEVIPENSSDSTNSSKFKSLVPSQGDSLII